MARGHALLLLPPWRYRCHEGWPYFTPYKSKFLKDLKGDKIPLGSELEYRPSAPKDCERLHKYGNKPSQVSSSATTGAGITLLSTGKSLNRLNMPEKFTSPE